jgi:hypothetical protein
MPEQSITKGHHHVSFPSVPGVPDNPSTRTVASVGKESAPMVSRKILQTQEIEFLLQELGENLSQRGCTSVQMMIIGGAYMLLNVGNRHSTYDIDVIPLNYTNSSQPDEKTRSILTSIHYVAQEHQLSQDWLNDAAWRIMGWLTPPIEQLVLWRRYGALELYMPKLDFIFVLKIFGYRDKDYNDIVALQQKLQIQTRAQAQTLVDGYIDRSAQREHRIDIALDEIFDE